jgi:WD40 repeat protein
MSSDGYTIATGTELGGDDSCILFFDIRSPAAPLRSHSQTHSQDITVVKFASNARTLLSASSDGLLCTSDPDQPDEDEAGIHVGNWGCSIAQAGWLDDNANRAPAVWAASDMETFSLWTTEVGLAVAW